MWTCRPVYVVAREWSPLAARHCSCSCRLRRRPWRERGGGRIPRHGVGAGGNQVDVEVKAHRRRRRPSGPAPIASDTCRAHRRVHDDCFFVWRKRIPAAIPRSGRGFQNEVVAPKTGSWSKNEGVWCKNKGRGLNIKALVQESCLQLWDVVVFETGLLLERRFRGPNNGVAAQKSGSWLRIHTRG